MKSAYLSIVALSITLAFPASLFRQATGQLEGIIYYQDQEPLLGINVSLEGSDKGGYTNPEGRFVIKNVPWGKYFLVVSGVGYLL
ncbi:MAG: carboxypeptidase-like regulatory domain-containing protein [Bacteroidota bacterium]